MQQATQVPRLAIIAILPALFFVQTVFAADKLQVYTVNYPLAYFAERIAGNLADVRFPAPPGVDPAFWMPDADTIAAYQAADLILLNGAGYAKWTDKVSLPRFRLVDTARGFKDSHIRVTDAVSHSHGPGGEHAHGDTAFTTWLDPAQAAQQAQAIAKALQRKRPQGQDSIERNLQTLKGDLLALDARLSQITAADPNRPLLASHPVYQYLARRYGLNLKSVTWEPHEVPGEAQWTALERILKHHRAQWMLWEGEPAPATVARLRRLGVTSVVFQPCGNRPETGDFLSVMTQSAANLERVFR